MVAGLPYGQHFAFRTVVESIEAMNLGYFENEGTHRFDFQFCALSYSANLDDFNFLVLFVDFFLKIMIQKH
jgi:hypothetical protein